MYLEDRYEVRTNLTVIASTCLWIAALAVWIIAWVSDQRYLSALSILIVVGAATLSIRSFILRQAREIHTALVVTGRDVVRPHAVP